MTCCKHLVFCYYHNNLLIGLGVCSGHAHLISLTLYNVELLLGGEVVVDLGEGEGLEEVVEGIVT